MPRVAELDEGLGTDSLEANPGSLSRESAIRDAFPGRQGRGAPEFDPKSGT